MAEFAYNNAKNASTNHTPFKFNYGYHLHVLFKENADSRSRSILADELLLELWKLISMYCKNFLHTQKFQKQAHDKSVKPRSYISSDKV